MNFGKFGHNFGTRNARKPVKPSKHSYCNLEPNKTLSHEIGSFGRLPVDDGLIKM